MSAHLGMTDTTIQQSAGFAMDLRDGSQLDGFARNVLSANALGPVNTGVQGVQYLIGQNTYSGNDVNEISIRGDGDILSTMTWQKLDVPDHLYGTVQVKPGGRLILAPGSLLQFEADASLAAEGGVLTAIGVPGDPITLTRAPGTTTYFKGISFHNTTDANNRLDHVEISFGGGATFDTAEAAGNLVVLDGAAISIANLTLSDTPGYGLVVNATGKISDCSGMQFSNNTCGDSNRGCPSP
jgi:hypothetical protein